MAQLVKISKPRLSGVQQRLRLFEGLDGAFEESPTVWIAGPAGAGKTTLAASYLDARRVDCLWYQLDETDADPGGFFHYLRRASEPLLGAQRILRRKIRWLSPGRRAAKDSPTAEVHQYSSRPGGSARATMIRRMPVSAANRITCGAEGLTARASLRSA
jgi:hypothetical protein